MRLAENLKGDSVKQFLKGFHSESTKESYCKKLSQFVSFCDMTPDDLLQKTISHPKIIQHLIIDYIEDRKSKVSGSTINQSIASLKHFFEMNDAEEKINWSKVSKLVPKARKTGNDRAPNKDEIRIMLDAADIRTKCIILVCSSSGIRVGAFEMLSWGDLAPLYKDTKKQKLIAAKIIVYKNTTEQYTTFVSPECYSMLLQYRNLRESVGEKINLKSPLIRNSWDNHRYRKNQSKNPGDARYLTSKTIANLMGEFLKRINLRDSSGEYEFKQIHGFRKYFKTNAERTIKTIDVEKLMGHAENYYKPSEDYLLEQYSKGIPDLTISEASDLKNRLEKQVIISDKKVGEIERENIELQDRLSKLESSYGSLKEILENVLLARTKQ